MKNKSRGFISTRGHLVLPLVLFCLTVFSLGSALADVSLKPTSNLSPRLEALFKNLSRPVGNQVSLKELGLSVSGPMSLVKNSSGQMLVYIKVTDTGEAQTSALNTSGASITHVSDRYDVVTAYVALPQMKTIAALPFVKYVSEVLKPVINQAECSGAITSEGDTQLRAAEARTINGVDGTGVIVGILSDSYAKVSSPTSANDDIASGDLPGAANPCGRNTEVNVIKEYTGDDGIDEGRGMAQIVHDLAPGASLAFATAFGGLYDFADNIVALRNQAGADIIVDDVSYYVEPFFQDGPISVSIAQVVSDGAQYYTSAGNSNSEDSSGHNISSYEAEAFRPTPTPTLYSDGRPVFIGAECHDFDPTATTTPYQQLVLENNGYVIVNFQWNEPWEGVVTDLDIYLTDASNEILAYSAAANIVNTQKPYESLSYQNTSGDDQTVRIYIARYTETGTPRCKYIFVRSSGVLSTTINATTNSEDTFGPSVFGHSGEDSAISVAAVPYNDSTTPEPFTSHGTYTVYYGPVVGESSAAPLASPETRQKPDVAATDGGANTFFGQLVGSTSRFLVGSTWRFYGTSAAAPHAAAVAALISQSYYSTYSAMPTQRIMETSLETTAVNIANGGQNISGAGLIHAANALTEALTHVAASPYDFNGDGKADILYRHPTIGNVGVWLMDGTTEDTWALIGNHGTAWDVKGVGDFNKDGANDILYRHTSGNVGVWLMDNTVEDTWQLLGNHGTAWDIRGAGDFNGDGYADVLYRQTATGNVGVWLMNGTIEDAWVLIGNHGTSWDIKGIGDFNSDGEVDVLYSNANGKVGIWLMNGTSETTWQYLGNHGTYWQPECVADYNNDGQADVVYQNTNGNVGVWLMTGAIETTWKFIGNHGVWEVR